MADRSIDTQLTKYLTDAHSIEEQALAQLKRAPDLAGAFELADALRVHLTETETHEQLVRARLEARDASPNKLKDVAARAGGVGFLLFAKLQPDTPGKLAAHAFSYEHLELACYDLLTRVAERAGDEETAAVTRRIRGEEDAMASRIGGLWDATVEASLAEKDADDLTEHLQKYLADAHAIEKQAIGLLEKSPKLAGDPMLARIYEEHLDETRDHEEAVAARLEAIGGSTNALKDAALRLGALNWGAFFAAQPDTPGKLAAFAYAFEHLEIGGYEQLTRVAAKAGDAETQSLAERLLAQEREAAERIYAAFDRAVDASLEAVGVH
jgi:ferritin-like metal-binding protein YciE